MSTPLKTLIAKLNPTCRQATERAASACLSRGHYEVELEHLFLALLEEPASDVLLVLRASNIDQSAVRRDLERELSRLQTGNTRTPVFSVHLIALFEQAWLIASLDSQIGRIRSGHLLLALTNAPELAQFAQRMSPKFASVRVDRLKHEFDQVTEGSVEAQAPTPAEETASLPQTGSSRTPALDTYTSDLTARARDGSIDPVIGREAEIRQAIAFDAGIG